MKQRKFYPRQVLRRIQGVHTSLNDGQRAAAKFIMRLARKPGVLDLPESLTTPKLAVPVVVPGSIDEAWLTRFREGLRATQVGEGGALLVDGVVMHVQSEQFALGTAVYLWLNEFGLLVCASQVEIDLESRAHRELIQDDIARWHRRHARR